MQRRSDTSHLLFSSFGNSEDIFRRVHSIIKNTISERRDTPTLNRFLTRDWRDAKEGEAVALPRTGAKVSITEIPGVSPIHGFEWRQFLGARYRVWFTGPLARILFTQSATFGQVTRTTGIINQADGKELALVLKGWGVTNEASNVSVDLDRPAQSQQKFR